MDAICPTTEEPIAQIAFGSPEDVEHAVEAAERAAPAWSRETWRSRARLLRDLASVLTGMTEDFARLDVFDAGLPLAGARYDVTAAIEELYYFAGLAGETKGTSYPAAGKGHAVSLRSPYSIVGRIVPFNHPFSFALSKIVAPLAAGSTVILKPSEHTSLSALKLGAVASELLPPGVLNILTGDGNDVGRPLAEHPKIPRVAFTGGGPAGKAVMAAAVSGLKRVTLELGGKNPFITLPGADLDASASAAVHGMNLWRTAGQSCQSTSIAYVHEDMYDDFCNAVVAAFESLTVGRPEDAETDVGPLAYRAHYDRVLRHIAKAKSEGAVMATGGERPQHLRRGYFLKPTVFVDVTPHQSIAQEEVFGPVLAIARYSDPSTLQEQLDQSPYGLTANIWGPIGDAQSFAAQVDAGLIWINGHGGRPAGAPFGGLKESGIGKEGSLDELLSYTYERVMVRPQ